MEKINIDLKCTNAAFEESPRSEVARILHELANKISSGLSPAKLKDINGNTVGTVTIKE